MRREPDDMAAALGIQPEKGLWGVRGLWMQAFAQCALHFAGHAGLLN
jgi:hypothetical protein